MIKQSLFFIQNNFISKSSYNIKDLYIKIIKKIFEVWSKKFIKVYILSFIIKNMITKISITYVITISIVFLTQYLYFTV